MHIQGSTQIMKHKHCHCSLPLCKTLEAHTHPRNNYTMMKQTTLQKDTDKRKVSHEGANKIKFNNHKTTVTFYDKISSLR